MRRCGHGNHAGGRPGRNGGRDLHIRIDGETGRNAIEGDIGRPGEATTRDGHAGSRRSAGGREAGDLEAGKRLGTDEIAR